MAAGKHSTRNASLNDAKERGAGREATNPQLNAALDPDNSIPAKGETGGAFGKDGQPNQGDVSDGAGGGGVAGENSRTAASAATMGGTSGTSRP